VGQDLIDAAQVLAVNAIEFGDTPDQLTKKIAKVSDQFAGYRARLIARDQVGKLQGQIHMTRMEDAGFERYEWMTVGDERVRTSHKARDGDIRTWEQSPKPGQEIQCRCQPVVIAEDIL
jgi:SPP1 gp7 family putative phage head morphogenesis protein